MPGRPTRRVIALECAGLVAAIPLAIWANTFSDWDVPLLLTLLALAIVSDLTAIQTAASHMKISGSFLAIITATVLIGPTAGTGVAVMAIGAGWARSRYANTDLLVNLVGYAWFPLLSGVAFHEAVAGFGADRTDGSYYLLVLALFLVALTINFALIAGYSSYVEGSKFTAKVERALMPVLGSEVTSAGLAVGIVYAYEEAGLAALGLFAIVLVSFQRLIGALLLSQERADELELRAKQLAGFQVALLSALLRTLDLRDRMTARHSAAVARYARELAARAGLTEEQQELAHTAGLLHDIGKFVLPDSILKTNAQLTEADWDQIRKHPYEGARIVSQVDGYQPVGEIILAHHERVDGLGYPRGLRGEEIPAISRIIAIADAYDVMTARYSYREPISSYEAIAELRRSAGTQLDPELVDVFIELLAAKDFAYRHGEDADFETELALDRRIHEYVNATRAPEAPSSRTADSLPSRRGA
jgi:putative nucleotidyltransferase with HDIG domain